MTGTTSFSLIFNEFEPHPQNKISLPFRVDFQHFRRSPLSLLYGSSPGYNLSHYCNQLALSSAEASLGEGEKRPPCACFFSLSSPCAIYISLSPIFPMPYHPKKPLRRREINQYFVKFVIVLGAVEYFYRNCAV